MTEATLVSCRLKKVGRKVDGINKELQGAEVQDKKNQTQAKEAAT